MSIYSDIRIVIIGSPYDTEPLLDAGCFGPFENDEEAQEFARAKREEFGLPCGNIEPTVEENEEWTDAGWTFGIFVLKK